jgi:hypothetical protein
MDSTNVEPISQWLWLLVHLFRILAWPVLIGLVVWYLQDGISKLLQSFSARTLKIKAPGGFEASVDAPINQGGDAGTKITGAPITAAAPLEPAPRAAVMHLEEELRQQLAGIDPAEQNARLFRELAETRLRAGHEAIYNRIFGSQLNALRNLDQRGTGTVAEALQFYNALIPLYPTMYPGYSFDNWLGFMITNGLVIREGDQLRAGVYGHDFLLYITELRLSTDKPY